MQRIFAFASAMGLCLSLFSCSDSGGNQPAKKPDAGGSAGRGGTHKPDAGTDRSACVPDESAAVPSTRCSTDGSSGAPPCNQWVKVEPDGAQCGNGSQYKFFVNYSSTSNNLVVMFEPGGACWDYPSCSGTGGIRGAANPNGIPDDHLMNLQYLNLLRRNDQNPAQDWNMVFVSYCTGDVHTGNKVATYEDPSGGPALTYRHVGHDNTMKVISWLNDTFKTVPRLLVTGCSAGGIGALQNYFFIRQGMPGAQCGYLLDDSGPAFHSDGPSKQLHEKIREAWNLDPLLDQLDGKIPVKIADLKQDFGLINTAIADLYPHDRLSLTLYRMDLNYSLYSYQRFFPGSTEDEIHKLWWQDVQALTASYDTRSNLAYYIPYFRHDNCSHCVSIPPVDHDNATILGEPWLGSEIEQSGINLKDFTTLVLDNTKPLQSYIEDPQPDEVFTSDESMMCMQGG
jgi:hypothetical protein